MIYVINLCSTCSCVLIHWFRDLQYLLILVSSAFNQFLYAWRMDGFRRAFGRIHPIFVGWERREKRSTVSVSNEQSTGADLDDMRKFEN